MRFLIEPKSQEAETKLRDILLADTEHKEYELISEYEPIEKLSGQVERVGNALKEFKESGINWYIFSTYMRGRGISGTLLKRVMKPMKEFFEEVGMKI